MATAVGAGFDISKLLDSITKADKALTNLMDKNNQTSKSIIGAFQQMANQGVVPYTKSLEKNLSIYNSIRETITDTTGKAKRGFGDMKSEIDKVILSTDTLLKTLSQTSQFKDGLGRTIASIRESREMMTRVGYRTDGATWGVSAEDTIKSYQRDMEERRKYIAERKAMYERMFDEIERKEKKSIEERTRYEQSKFNESLSKYRKNKEDQAKVDRHYHAQRQKEYEEMFRAIERTQQRERAIQNARGDSSKGALNYYNRLYSDRGVMSINNMNTALQKLRDAQNRLNLSTDEGKRKHKELGEAIRRVEGDMKKYSSLANEVSHKHKNLMNTGEQLKRALLGVFSVSAIKGYVSKLVEVRGEFELQHRALTVLVGDVDEANRLWNKTVQLAVKSPFAVKELVTYTKQLSAYRVESDKLYDTTKMLADISAGLGVDMNRLILAYGQVKAANYLRGTELRQFSEAGINVLKELSDYYTEIEGKTISIGEVFDRVSKRMVSFQDVNTVLEKVTGSGGQFYKMQEKQAETVKGMWMNLRDSIDLMLNDIGVKNETIIKGSLKITKNIIENWEKIGSIALPILSTIITKMAVTKGISFFTEGGWNKLCNAIKYTTLLLSKGKVTADRFANSLSGFDSSSFMKGGLATAISLAIVLISRLAIKIAKHKAQLKEIDKEYNKLKDDISQITFDFNVAKKDGDIDAQKAKLQELIDIANKEYRLNIKVDVQAMTAQELEKEAQRIAMEVISQGAFSQGAEESLVGDEKATKSIKEYGDEFSNTAQKAIIASQKISIALSHLENNGEELAEAQKEALEVFMTPFDPKKETQTQYYNRIIEAYRKLNSYVEKEATEYAKKVRDSIEIFSESDYEDSVDAFHAAYAEYISKALAQGLSLDLSDLDEYREKAVKNIAKWLASVKNKSFVGDTKKDQIRLKATIDKQEFTNDVKELMYQVANTQFGMNIKPIIKQPDEKTLAKWQIEYNKFVDTLSTKKVLKMDANTDAEQYISILKGTYETYSKTIKAWDAGNAKARAEYSEEEIESIRKQNNERKKALDWLVYEEKKKNEENEALQRLKKQISLIRESAKAYDDMRKLHDEAYASERIVSDYEDAFREAGLGDIGGYSFGTREDELNNLNKLKNSAEQVTGGMLELSRATAQVSVQVDNANKELADKRLFDAISDIFSNYEISLEMDKLNIPSDLAEKIFGFEAIDLNDIRRKVLEKFGLGFMSDTSNQEIYESELFKSMSKERQDELRKSLEMESKLQNDALKDRLKTYTKYLREEQDERIKIKLEEIRKLEEVESMNEYDDAQKATIKANIRAEAEKDMMKKSWESFERSPDFLNLFDDMSKATTQSLEDMKMTLDKLKGSMIAAGLPASDLKDILDKINKVEEELENRKPFQSLKEDWSTLFGSDYKKALDDEKILLEERRRLEAEKKAIEDRGPDDFQLNILNTEKERLSSMEKGSEEYRQQKELVDGITKSLYPNQERYEEILKLLEQNGVKLDEAQSKTRKWKDSCEDIAEHFIAIGDAVNQVGGALGTTLVQMGLMSEETKAIYDSYMSVADNALNLGGNVMKLIANPADPQAWVGAITNTISMIGNIAATGDAVREKQIQAEMKKVDRLEKAYEKLEKEMEDAYTIDQLNVNKKSMEQNIDAQIKSLESAKAKEEANKNVDQDAVDDYDDRINELEEKKAELQRNIVEGLGGTYDYKSVAEDFLDAWLTSFNETGNGLKGLEGAFDDFIKNIAKNQIIQGGLSEIIAPLMNKINKDLVDNSIIDDWDAIFKEYATVSNNASSFIEGVVNNLKNIGIDLTENSEGELSGLQSGIQGITEEQAGILEAYWNAVRMDVSAVRFRFEDYANKMLSSDVEVNPMLSQLTTIANHTSAINTLLDSVAKNSADDGSLGIRVYMNNA